MVRILFIILILWISLEANSQLSVVFNVDLRSFSGFDPAIHKVYFSGSTSDYTKGIGGNAPWPKPGTAPTLLMTDADGDRIYSLSVIIVLPGDYVYKYFLVENNQATWSLGEWDGAPNRTCTLNVDQWSVNNLWGSLTETFSGSLVINEIMATNGLITDEDGDYEDWLELYNGTPQAINLGGYGLTDDRQEKNKWVFPSTTLLPGEHLLVWASGKDRDGGTLHCNFKINQENESIYLFAPDGVPADSVTGIKYDNRVSYSRLPDGKVWKYTTSVTPGHTNESPGYDALLRPVTASASDGFYSEPVDVSFLPADTGVVIRYTTDGSEPNDFSPVYQQPLRLTSRAGLPNIFSMIPTNNNTDPGPPFFEGWQPPAGEVFKIHTIRSRAFRNDAPPGPVSTHTYVVDPKGADRYTLPVFSLSTDAAHLFDPETGIYVAGNHNNYSKDWERPAHITFFEAGGRLGFKDNIAIQINGNTTASRPRKSIRVSYKDHIGKDWLNYRLFPQKPLDRYKQFILRNSGNDWDFTVFRDGLFHTLASGLHIETQDYLPSVVFINGEYWGIHNIRDKYNDHYLEAKYNLQSEEIVIGSNAGEYKWGNEAGMAHYQTMYDYIKNNNLQNSAQYSKVTEMMDTGSFIDFQIANIYAKNTDWPGNNTLYWRYMADGQIPGAGVKDGRWRWMILDLDFGFDLPFYYVPGLSQGAAHNTLGFAMEPNGPGWPNPSWSTLMLRKLMANTTFKNEFINRYCDLLNTRYATGFVITMIDSLAQNIRPEMAEHSARWRRPENKAAWEINVTALQSFASQRTITQFQHIQATLGAGQTQNVTVNVSDNAHGHVKINTIHLAGTTMGVASNPYPWTGKYFTNVPVRLEAIPAPGYEFSHWSGSNTSTSPTITLNLTAAASITAHFRKSDKEEVVYFWYFDTNLPNDVPLQGIESTYFLTEKARLEFVSCYEGYPFASGHPQYRKGSMERRNSPTVINYRAIANNNKPFDPEEMRGLQVKQPFAAENENRLFLNFSTSGLKDVILSFAVKNEGAVDSLLAEYLTSEGRWTSDFLEQPVQPLLSDYSLISFDFKNVASSVNNADFKIRLSFKGRELTADDNNRVTFNNISVSASPLLTHADDASNGSVVIFPNPATDALHILGWKSGEGDAKVLDMNGRTLLESSLASPIDVSHLANGVYMLLILEKGRLPVRKTFIKCR